MTGSRDAQSDSGDDGRLSPGLLGLAIGAVDVPVFAYLGLELFDDPAFGAFVGLVIGLGIFLSFPAFVADDDERSEPQTDPAAVGDRLRRFHRTAAGLALPPAGILLFSWRFVSETLLMGALATLVIAVAIYVPLVVLLPRRLA
ncbi:hypothetical protein [Natrinema salaciae]|uniref:Uncharacterized protein n=1 Tax=Natrinema salaciae TaxID=1186196 RepID=A0A1H9JQY1_9EURY|nr:hypothetical protein [Natrinema salaciae]SEQ89242.1 hypothetical protein SAMN04489841_2653 [Natrinema salaciae]